jgi:hypothetical protein
MLSSLNGSLRTKAVRTLQEHFVIVLHRHDEINTIIQIGSGGVQAVGAQR